MSEYEAVLASIDRQISDFKVEGLVQTASLLEGVRASIERGGTDMLGWIASIAHTIEHLERRIVEIEARER